MRDHGSLRLRGGLCEGGGCGSGVVDKRLDTMMIC